MKKLAEWVAKNRRIAIGVCIVLLMAVTIGLRMLLVPYLLQNQVPPVLGADPWYNIRQIELMVAHYPTYNWFDPMTAFPTGKLLDWGPLFPFIAATIALLSGAATREEVLFSASFVPPLLAALTVPVVYLLGKTLYDWKAGLVAAAAIAIIPGGYFLRTSFGFVDHHAAEVLFSTLFCLLYIQALRYAAARDIRLNDPSTYLHGGVLAAGAGVAYLLGLLVMPTMIIFALIVALFTLVQYITAPSDRRSCISLALVNGIAFSIVLVVYSLSMIQREGFSLATYTVGHSSMYGLLVAGTLVLLALSYTFGRNITHFVLSLVVVGIAGITTLLVALPSVGNTFTHSLAVFFGSTATAHPIQEMEAMSLAAAWSSFNVGIFLFAAGIVALALAWYRGRQPWYLFVLAWAAVILPATLAHVRYEYYLSVLVALAAGIIFAYCSEASHKGTDVPTEKKARATGKKEKIARKTTYLGTNAMSLVLLALVLFGMVSLYQDATSPGRYEALLVPDDWTGALTWLSGASPDPGVEYLGVYSPENRSYIPTAYGVLSLWDYGHWITVLGKRIPNSNPFQDNTLGRYGTIAFLMAPGEEEAEKIATRLGSRYIITDIKMANTKFVNTAALYNSSRKSRYYTWDFMLPAEGGRSSSSLTLIDSPYYQTMIAKLHALDGSLSGPGKAYYLEYQERAGSVPVITHLEYLPYETARERKDRFSGSGGGETSAAVLSNSLAIPLSRIPALQHYRLVYESPHTDPVDGLSEVKIFERVKGARIAGEGTIELDLVTNQGRKFTYRQESRNGTFIVPYSTVQNPYPVRAEGPYRVVGSSLAYEVSEQDVREGRPVSAQ
ncbi:MAG: oligosaccharyl transferase, archaeosortase A system-associated [Methanolinea sp.]|nr:oligosaccharyl transferase, archaeosortase A system-associated [Methanolinea sp.]